MLPPNGVQQPAGGAASSHAGAAASPAAAVPSSSIPPAAVASAAATPTPTPTPVVLPSDDGASLSALLTSGLTALYKHSSRRQEALRQQCVEVISRIKAEDKARADKAAKGVLVPADCDANKYFLPLKLACDTGQAKLVALALDCMEKLVAYGYLDGNCPAPEELYPSKKKDNATTTSTNAAAAPAAAAAAAVPVTPANASNTAGRSADASAASGATTASSTTAGGGPDGSSSTSSSTKPRRLIHVMMETLHECSMFKDALVQRQVLKALLTVVSSVSCPVHDHCLLQSVTSCYQIYLQAGDETNRTTSRAALTQIFNIVFQRMEHFAAQLKQLDDAARQQREADKATSLQLNEGIPTASPRSVTSPSSSEAAAAAVAAADAAGATTAEDPSAASASEADAPGSGADSINTTGASVGVGQLDLDSETQAQPVEPSLGDFDGGSGDGSSSSAPTPTAGNSVSVSSRASPSLTPRAAPGVRGYCVVCSKPANHLCLQTRDAVCGMECKLSNLAKRDPNRKQALSVKARIANKLQILQNDAYYLLRALIKLSHKSLSQSGVGSPPDQAAVDSKLLSLTLLLSVMQNAGPTFASSRTFIALVKVDLVNCLLRNSAASQIDSIFTLSSQIFVATLRSFKPHLHRSIGPMLDSIYLPYIQSAYSSFAHKHTSLSVIRDICRDHQLLVDLFLNYDCDIGSFNTFQKIAEVLEKTAHARRGALGEDGTDASGGDTSALGDGSGTSEEQKLKTLALEALVAAMSSLAHWTTRIVKPNAQTMLEAIEHADGEQPMGAGRSTALAAIGAAAAAAAMKSGETSSNSDDSSRARSGSSTVGEDGSAFVSPSPPPHPSSSPALPFSSLSTGAQMASSFSTQFQLLRAQKQKLDSGIAKFNAKPKVGLAYLQQHGLLAEDPVSIARFFHSNTALDKVQLGDYMGDEHAFNKAVLYAYVEQMDFSGLSFDESIREFLQGFRLPGEAQKIDRMMEKFAEQYHKNNPGRFHSADTAYVLAYSIIMLNTDAHNAGVKVRMTKQDFFKNCRGIDDGKDIDPAFLGEIYDRITTNEIKMKDDPLVAHNTEAKKVAAVESSRTRFSAFVKESQQMVRRTQELIKTTVDKRPSLGAGSSSTVSSGGAASSGGGGGAGGPQQFRAGGKLSSNEQKFLQEVSQDRLDQPDTAAPTPSAGGGAAGDKAANGTTSVDGASTARSPAPSAPSSSSVSVEKTFYEATDEDAEAIRPMFEILCFPSLATFSVLLEESENDTVVRLCLAGYRAAIRIATALELQTARLAFISSLQRFTHLGSGKPMRRKHIDAIATLLALGSTPAEGNHLKQNWVEVLHTISEVERMQLIATNTMRGRESGGVAVHDHALLISGAPVTSVAGVAVNPAASIHTSGSNLAGAGWGSGGGIMGTSSIGGSGVGGGPSTDTLNSLQVQLLDPALIDRVFACSAQLDGEAIVDFVQALRSVSEAELANTAAPRVFSLQKMVEVTRANMGRVRIVWSRIWALLAAFFQKAGTHPHIHVSMYAIDSLRQLAMKFLELDELVSFQFQRQFMRPFEVIMASNPNGEIRELILQCIERMIAAKAANIKSGWKGVFLVLQVAANSEANNNALTSSTAPVPTSTGGRNGIGGVSASSLVVQAFSILSNIMDNYFDLLSAPDAAGAEGVEECVNCLVTFGCQTKQQDISAKAIHYLTNCASTLTANTSSTASANVSPAMTTATLSMADVQQPSALQVDGNTPTLAQRKLSQQQHQSSVPSTPRHNSSVSGIAPQTALKTWFLVLTGLSRMVSDPRTEVRSLALKTLFEILHAHGHVFTQQTWRTVFHGVLFPIFDDVRYANEAHRGPGSASAAVLVSPEPPAAAAGTPARKSTAAQAEEDASATSFAASAAPSTAARSSSAVQPTAQQPQGARPRRQSSHIVGPAVAVAAAASSSFDQTWLSTTCFTALSSLVDLFVRFHPSVFFLLPELLRLLQGCIVQAHAEALAKIGVRCLAVLLAKIGAELTVGDWWVLLRAVEDTLLDVLPTELVSPRLRAALMLPQAQGPLPIVYEPLVRDAQKARAEVSASSAAASSAIVNGTDEDDASAAVVNANSALPSSATLGGAPPPPPGSRLSTPVAHSRSVSASASPAGGGALSLPFALAPMQTRIKVQLWLVEGLFQAVMKFFPKKDLTVQRLREERNSDEEGMQQQQSTPAAEADGASASSASSDNGASSSSFAAPPSSVLLDSSDRRVLGCLTPVQALYAVDLLSLVLNTSHAFNADITLRRKLHTAGFAVPPPNMAPPAAAAQPMHAPQHSPQPPSTVPPSPAPVPQYVSPLHALPTSASAPVQQSPAPAPGVKQPARLPQLFYHEAHVLRLSMDILFRLVACEHGNNGTATAAAAGVTASTNAEEAASNAAAPIAGDHNAPSSLWQAEVRVVLPSSSSSAAASSSSSSSSDPSSPTHGTLISLAESRVVSLAAVAAADYVAKTRAGQLVSLECMDEVLVGLVSNVAAFPRPLFLHALPRFYSVFCDLVEFAGTAAIRHAVRQLFANNIAALLQEQGIRVLPTP